MNNFVVYEQPVAENIIRSEYLHEKINSSLSLKVFGVSNQYTALLEMSDFSKNKLKVELQRT